MTRLAVPLAAAAATLILVAPALAADMSGAFDSGTDLRSGFSDEWDNSDQNDPLSFEFGLRYWYSWGAQSFGVSSTAPAIKVTDRSQSLEGQFRIDDASSKWYLKGLGGASFAIDGSLDDSVDISNGHIAYAGADIGYSMLGDGKNSPAFGPFLGYMYWNDSPNGANNDPNNNFTTAASANDVTIIDPATGLDSLPGSSTPDNVEVNMLRLGFSGKTSLGSMIDISGEVAAVPYAKMSGVLGTSAGSTLYYTDPPGSGTDTVTNDPAAGYNVAQQQSSPTNVDGWGYGAMIEGLVGFHPTQNLTFRLGGRLWYLQGKEDATFSRVTVGNPTQNPVTDPPDYNQKPSFSSQDYITRDNPWSLLRYGLLAEMTYNF